MDSSDKSRLNDFTYKTFSDRNMFILAIIAIPVILLDYYTFSSNQSLIVDVVNWLLWVPFVLEFVLKVYLRKSYIYTNKFDSLISLIIILTPIGSVIYNAFYATGPALRLLSLSRLIRGAALAVKAGKITVSGT